MIRQWLLTLGATLSLLLMLPLLGSYCFDASLHRLVRLPIQGLNLEPSWTLWLGEGMADLVVWRIPQNVFIPIGDDASLKPLNWYCSAHLMSRSHVRQSLWGFAWEK